jgi:hypothetical protein
MIEIDQGGGKRRGFSGRRMPVCRARQPRLCGLATGRFKGQRGEGTPAAHV